MAKARKVHVQLELRKADKNGQRRGGRRAGAGRPPSGLKARASHLARPELRSNEPVHVTLRVVAAVTGLRKRHIYQAVRWAMVSTFDRPDFHIVHLSLQADHLHLLVEADDKRALSRGLQGFLSVAARFINEAISERTGRERTGRVFADRYHAEIIRSPRQARNALRYVLNNWRKHGEDRGAIARSWLVDPFSSAISFPGWIELDGSPWLWRPRASYDPLPTWKPRTWLLWKGWRRSGPISAWDAPGARA